MLSRKKRIKQMNFQSQERRIEEMKPLSDDDKYIIEKIEYLKTELDLDDNGRVELLTEDVTDTLELDFNRQAF